MPRFVLLYHDCPPEYVRSSHWDFMLESGDVLRTWALPTLPRAWASAHARTAERCAPCPPLADVNNVVAERLGDHRREYLEFEGELTGERGSVIRVAAGTYVTRLETPEHWQFCLTGDFDSGPFQLTRSDAGESKWILASTTKLS